MDRNADGGASEDLRAAGEGTGGELNAGTTPGGSEAEPNEAKAGSAGDRDVVSDGAERSSAGSTPDADAGTAEPVANSSPAADDAGPPLTSYLKSAPTDDASAAAATPSAAPRDALDVSIDGSIHRPMNAASFEVRSLRHFISSSRIPAALDAYVVAALRENRPLDHILIHGPIGSGTTTLARAVILDYAPRKVVEIDALDGCDVATLRRAIHKVRGTGVLFIRHIEVLDHACDLYLAKMMGRDEIPREHRLADARRSTEETRLDPSNARATGDFDRAQMRPRFTLLATAHFTTRVGYVLRCRFDHLLHLREDPVGLSRAVARVVERRGTSIDDAAMPRLERVVGSLLDSADPIVKAISTRAELEGVRRIDDALMRSILEQDLADRMPDESYALSLRRIVAGMRLDDSLLDEIPHLAERTGWGELAVHAAIACIIREEPKKAA